MCDLREEEQQAIYELENAFREKQRAFLEIIPKQRAISQGTSRHNPSQDDFDKLDAAILKFDAAEHKVKLICEEIRAGKR